MINKGSKGALFLPEVAVSNGWDLHTFLDELCRKADLPEESWHDREAELYVFESEAELYVFGVKMSSSADFVFRQLRPLFFSGDAETAHERMLSSVEMVSKIPGVIPFLRWQFREESPVLHTKLFGKTVNNPIGLAAGFDKDGRIYPALFALGFGFVEIGTVTPLPQAGNLKPRIFRLLEDQALVNRLGFNNQGIQKLVEKLDSGTKKISPEEADMINQSSEQHEKFSSGMLGINIGKNGDTSLEKAREDYVSALSALHPFADYFTINISSPNTEGLRRLQEKQMLRELLESVCSRRDKLDQNHIRKTPLACKTLSGPG